METTAQPSEKGIFSRLEKVSWKAKQAITAITTAVLSSLGVVIVLLVEPKVGGTVGFTWLAALGTAIAVGAVTFALQQIAINEFNRMASRLKTMLNAVARDSENVKADIGPGKAWEEVAIAFDQMQEAIAIRVGEAQQKVAALEKAKEELQQQLIELTEQVEKDKSLGRQSEETASNEEEQVLEARGTILEFMDDFHQEPIPPELILGSSTIEEVKQRFEQLQYRRAWLQALLDEASREVALLKTHLHL